jgi:hypothetical protein
VWKQLQGQPQSIKQDGPSIQFTRTIPIGQLTDDVLSFSVTAVDAPPSTLTSNTVTASVTVKPVPDTDIITSAQYRTSKGRLDLTASSSVVNPGLTLTLQPYKTVQGTTFDPAALGAALNNAGGGNYTLTLVGAPQPAGAVLVIKSNIGGVSAAVAPTVRN